MAPQQRQEYANEIAIIGMDVRVPGATSLGDFWRNLRNGVESITALSDEELEVPRLTPAGLMNDPNYVKAGAIVEGVELFDPAFFGFTPREAEFMDPQIRLLLQSAWSTLERAGYDPERYRGAIGVFVGAASSGYLMEKIVFNREIRESLEKGYSSVFLWNERDTVATLISYKLNLTGPSLTVQTYCSTSMVAVHLACQSLLTGESEMALAGGVSISTPQKSGYLYKEGMILSPDGHCRVFDADAKGTIFGNGLGLVLLKRMSDAIADGDTIHAVIKGSAINNDGSQKAGYTAPSVVSQSKVIAEALAVSDVKPDTIHYVEAHGTATPIGDPIEIEALTKAFRLNTQARQFCAIGSVKGNIGHLDRAAGVTSLIKTVLALENREIPPTLHHQRPNPMIDFASSPFFVNTELAEWKSNGIPRRAGVNALGFGGTNVHVVLEEAPPPRPSDQARSHQLLLLSARTKKALDRATVNLAEHLRQHPELNLADVAYTLQVGRRLFKHSRMLVCTSMQDAVSALESIDPKRLFTQPLEYQDPPVVFMFPGQGSQYVNMGLELYQGERVFTEAIDHCSQLLQPHLGLDLRQVLYPSNAQITVAEEQLIQTQFTQPALFVVEYALARLWMSWGVKPQAMIGHSIGEYVAACLAGVLSLEDALKVVAGRARLIQAQPRGAMLAVHLPERDVLSLLNDRLSVAAVNSPSLCVVSGSFDEVRALEERLEKKGIPNRRLHTSHAFHSIMMGAVLEPFADLLRQIEFKSPQIPFVSNVTGTWITADEAMNPDYWVSHVRQSVRFGDDVAELSKDAKRILLEVGPGQALSTLAKQCDGAQSFLYPPLSSLPGPRDRVTSIASMLQTLGKLCLAGVQVDWEGFHADERRQRIPLPTYPFDQQRCWIEPKEKESFTLAQPAARLKKADAADWYYIPSWKRSTPLAFHARGEDARPVSCLVFLDDCGLGSRLADKLSKLGHTVVTVSVGKQFHRRESDAYDLNPRQPEDYRSLLRELRREGRVPRVIGHCWCVTPSHSTSSSHDSMEQCLDLGFFSLICLTQAMGDLGQRDPVQMLVISNNMHDVGGETVLSPEKATVLGPCKVIPQEYPNIACGNIDIELPEWGSAEEQQLLEQLAGECFAETSHSIVAYRSNYRWVKTYEPIRLEEASHRSVRLREEGVYLITGGLGGIGLVLAEHLARTVRAKLILTGRTGLPSRVQWNEWLESHDDQDVVSRRIRKVRALEELGAEVLVVAADTTDRGQMQSVIGQAEEKFGEIHGVIHAAGIAGGGMVQLKTREIATDVFSPKVKGTLVLADVLENKQLDFLILCSSVASIFGGIGQVDYCGANAFLDAFANCHSFRTNLNPISINWDAWQEVGMAVNTAIPEALKAARAESLKSALSPQEGVNAFTRILGSGLSQVIVSTKDLNILLQAQNTLSPPNVQGQAGATLTNESESPITTAASSLHPRPELDNDYVPPQDALQKAIAETWQKLLGVDQIGAHDNFFDLGGHSLLAMQVVSRMREVFQVELPMRLLFEASTVAALAERVETLRWAAEGARTARGGASGDREEIEL
jgi:acyl transferase domain-containing protein/acyl carrier protein